ncbi:hypothetical protein V5799_022548 [Amblyomma americanum]|uniref:Uncharacterized protein n=1 Tax=Amblyomma americanum TaxID=6943 RepID=A0AAQ4FM79_AMBAM
MVGSDREDQYCAWNACNAYGCPPATQPREFSAATVVLQWPGLDQDAATSLSWKLPSAEAGGALCRWVMRLRHSSLEICIRTASDHGTMLRHSVGPCSPLKTKPKMR